MSRIVTTGARSPALEVELRRPGQPRAADRHGARAAQLADDRQVAVPGPTPGWKLEMAYELVVHLDVDLLRLLDQERDAERARPASVGDKDRLTGDVTVQLETGDLGSQAQAPA